MDIKHPRTDGEGLFFLRGNVIVSPLRTCIYALLMKCDGERSWVCLQGAKMCTQCACYSAHTRMPVLLRDLINI